MAAVALGQWKRYRAVAGLSDEDLRARVSKILPINLGALFVSMIGLMAVIIGVMLG